MLSLHADQLGFGEYMSTKYERTFIVVSNQTDLAKHVSTAQTF